MLTMDCEGILLRQPEHIQQLVIQLTEQQFADTFGDLRLVFSDGEFTFYKLLLSALSRDWGRMLRDSDQADLVILEGVKKQEFLRQIVVEREDTLTMEDMIVGSDDSDIKIENEEVMDDIVQDELDEDIITNASKGEVPIDTQFNPVTVSDTFSISDIKVDIDLEAKSGERLLSFIKPKFDWPNNLNFPNFHSIGWGSASGLVFEVMGNRSIFTVLQEKHNNLPSTSAFTIKYPENDQEKEKNGIFNLKDFLSGGVASSLEVFQVEGTEEKLSLSNVLKKFGYRDEANSYLDAKNIIISIGEECSNLKDWMDIWKQELAGDVVGQELLGGSKFDRNVIKWVRSQASTTSDGGVICCYCGLVCYDQSTRETYNYHIRKHLYRKKKCKMCSEGFLAGEKHICNQETPTKVKSDKKFPCTECDAILGHKANLKRHLKSHHNIVDKVVVMRECGFCLKMVPNLSSHYIEFHKNETLSCLYCDKTFSNPAKHKSHVNISHKRIYAGFCDICQKEVHHLSKHNLYLHQQRTWPCDHCDKVFKLKTTLRDHMQSVEGTREKKPCPECGNLYVNVPDHIRRFHRGYRRQTKHLKHCNKCDKYLNPQDFEEHRLTCKREETICHICSKKVLMIEQHLAQQHQVTDIQCCLCGENFVITTDLHNHIRSNHFPNIIKEAGFLETDLLTEEVFKREAIATKIVDLYSATQEGNMQCKLCNFTTNTKIGMIVHMKDHLGYNWRKGKKRNHDIDRMCSDCGLIVKFKGMSSHQASCRKKVEKLVIRDSPEPTKQTDSCPECGLLGLNADTYVQHVLSGCTVDREMIVELELEVDSGAKEKIKRKRTGVKISNVKLEGIDSESAFTCGLCASIFRKRPYLNKHMKRVHGGKKILVNC